MLNKCFFKVLERFLKLRSTNKALNEREFLEWASKRFQELRKGQFYQKQSFVKKLFCKTLLKHFELKTVQKSFLVALKLFMWTFYWLTFSLSFFVKLWLSFVLKFSLSSFLCKVLTKLCDGCSRSFLLKILVKILNSIAAKTLNSKFLINLFSWNYKS